MASSDEVAPTFLRLAAHPLRWRLLSELAGSDLRVRELVDRTGQPQNLVSYHLRLLRGGGLVTARRSSFDGRDSYYHLDLDACARGLAGAVEALHPGLRLDPPRFGRPAPVVLFACTGNSARSPMAEALLRHRAGRIDVTSAGSHPKPAIDPDAVRAIREHHGTDLAGYRPRHLDAVRGRRFDVVISLCDKVRESGLPGAPRLVHWSIPEPAGYPAFVDTVAELDARIGRLLPTLAQQTPEVRP